ncbi:MAG: hypothetical protein J6K04_02535 [Lachnospiraceae bacterium]|nr:hypothetical protein [Lachnospiraceae bacterium]
MPDLLNELLELMPSQIASMKYMPCEILVENEESLYIEKALLLNEQVQNGYKALDLAGKICGVLSLGNKKVKTAYKKEKESFMERMEGILYVTEYRIVFRGKAYMVNKPYKWMTAIERKGNTLHISYGEMKDCFLVPDSEKLFQCLLHYIKPECKVINSFYYNELAKTGMEEYRQAYIMIYTDILQCKKMVLTDMKEDRAFFDRMLFMVLADHPEIYYVNPLQTEYNEEETIIRIYYKYLLETLSLQDIKHKEKVRKKVCSLTEKAKLIHRTDREQQIKYLYEYLVTHISYAKYELKNEDEMIQCRIHSALGALLDEKAVCDGIARGFKMLLDELGIENRIIRQDIRENMEYSHEWNVITLNGKELHADITWEHDLYSVRKQVLYKFFGLTEEEMWEKHQKGSALECFRQKTNNRKV